MSTVSATFEYEADTFNEAQAQALVRWREAVSDPTALLPWSIHYEVWQGEGKLQVKASVTAADKDLGWELKLPVEPEPAAAE
jgi:hypothetical protein